MLNTQSCTLVILSAAKDQPPTLDTPFYSTQNPPIVILNAVKNLVLHREVTPFLWGSAG
jgi:hypothetical protein